MVEESTSKSLVALPLMLSCINGIRSDVLTITGSAVNFAVVVRSPSHVLIRAVKPADETL
jgi:hypothetical protein